MPPVRLALLWHMHQPVYRDPETGELILPWVRLHATRAYYDMPRALAEFPRARATINLVPSLLDQLQTYVDGRAKDRFLDLTIRPADALEPAEQVFLLRNFFMADWETCIRPLPRFWELLHKRGPELARVDLAQVATGFSRAELRDLQVLFNLAWFGFRAREEEPALRELIAKGQGFTEDDKAAMLALQTKILGQVMPALTEVWRAGQAEITVTPYYHPILPLLCDSDAARRAMPQAQLPPRFAFPEDAHAQVRLALDYAEAHLGARPRGMWPAEGSVSPEALAVFAAEGVEYVCSDEGVLLHSLPGTSRDEALHRTYAVQAGPERTIKMLFRDHGLSDLVGFTYSKRPAPDAVRDLFGHLGRIAQARAPEVPTVSVILDGENPWEHYADSGREFLRALYGALDRQEGGVEAVTLGEAFARAPPARRIERIHSGSWIEASYRIWIGHPEDNLGWELLGQARRLLAERERAGHDREKLEAARAALLVAEGSDWFWWYGDDFTTESAAEFDALFRGYVARAFRALDAPVPPRLEEAISRKARAQQGAMGRGPESLIQPPIDGRATSYFAWAGAGEVRPEGDRGAMFQAEGVLARLCYGFDLERLYLRLEPAAGWDAVRARADEVQVEVKGPSRVTLVRVALGAGEAPQPALAGTGEGVGRAALRDILTMMIPFASLGLVQGERLGLAASVVRGQEEVERLPRRGHVRLAVPGPDFERLHWRV